MVSIIENYFVHRVLLWNYYVHCCWRHHNVQLMEMVIRKSMYVCIVMLSGYNSPEYLWWKSFNTWMYIFRLICVIQNMFPGDFNIPGEWLEHIPALIFLQWLRCLNWLRWKSFMTLHIIIWPAIFTTSVYHTNKKSFSPPAPLPIAFLKNFCLFVLSLLCQTTVLAD